MKIITTLSNGDTNIENYLYHLFEKCDKHDVSIDLVKRSYLKDDTGIYGGSFGLFPSPNITVAVKNPIPVWLPTLVHEACHMDQWIENAKVWEDLTNLNGSDSVSEFFEWLDGELDLTPHEAELRMKKTIDLEYDCEKRVEKTIKKFNLPIDTKKRKQQAMSYVWSYVLCYKYRRWYKGKNSPIRIEKVWKTAPNRFVKNKYLPTEEFIKSCSKYCFDIKI